MNKKDARKTSTLTLTFDLLNHWQNKLLPHRATVQTNLGFSTSFGIWDHAVLRQKESQTSFNLSFSLTLLVTSYRKVDQVFGQIAGTAIKKTYLLPHLHT